MDGADDFKACKSAYHAALGYYLAAGYTLILMGDVEDLWECFPKKVFKKYQDTFEFEKKFVNKNRYMRFWGNHDDIWRWKGKVKKQLGKFIGNNDVYEGKRFKIDFKGKEIILFLVHGHQGTLDSDRFKWLSRIVVRLVVRNFQRITRIRSVRPVNNFDLRKSLEKAMYSWVEQKEGVILIDGHTHHPVFASEIHEDDLLSKITELEKKLKSETDPKKKRSIKEEIYYKYAELEWVKSKSNSEDSGFPQNPKPCFFNAGSCAFSDGDITGIEIADGEIRLVRWPDDEGNPRKKVLKKDKLISIFKRL
jgi:UDP-2,3-diacylglucosamine pyrophosphatase LpxH